MKSPNKPARFEQNIRLLLNPAALSSMPMADLLLLVGRASNDLIDQALAAEENQAWHDAAELYTQLKTGLENAAVCLPDELQKQLLASVEEWDQRAQKLQQQAKLKEMLEGTKEPKKFPGAQKAKTVSVMSTQPTLSSSRSRIFKRQRPTLREAVAMKNSQLRKSDHTKIDIRKLQKWREDKQ